MWDLSCMPQKHVVKIFVIVIPKEGLVGRALPIFLLARHRLYNAISEGCRLQLYSFGMITTKIFKDAFYSTQLTWKGKYKMLHCLAVYDQFIGQLNFATSFKWSKTMQSETHRGYYPWQGAPGSEQNNTKHIVQMKILENKFFDIVILTFDLWPWPSHMT